MPEGHHIKAALKGTISRLRGSRRSPQQPLACLSYLPAEILLQIGSEILRDPETTIVEFKNLRLVCRSLNYVFTPIVLSSIHVFYPLPRGKVLSRFQQLRALTGGLNQLSHVRTLTLNSWDWIFQAHGRFGHVRFSDSDRRALIKAILWNYVLVPAGYFFWALYIDPAALPRQMRKVLARARAKRYVKHIDRISFQLPNVRRVNWWLPAPNIDSHKSVLLNLRILETLPSLEELELTFHPYNDRIHEIADTMSRLHNLRKITVRIINPSDEGQELHFNWLKQAIAHNPNLIYLDLYQVEDEDGEMITISDLFNDVPPDQPVKLEHIRLSPIFYQVTPTVSRHFRSVASINICFPYSWRPHTMDGIWQILYNEGIFVSDIQTNRVTQDMLNYLCCLNSLTSLSLYDLDSVHQVRNQESAKMLFPVLVRHSKTLRRLRLEPYDWGYWFCVPDNELTLMRCAELEEFVLHYVGKKHSRGMWRDVVLICDILSQLDSPFTLVLECDLTFYARFLKCCSDHPRLSIQDLRTRVVFKPSRTSCSYFI
ncbi:hypothetical protein AX15_003496 [Amanita polypyramis BW_CC]|nr:hypothetical protein AX15_003496 [Amanita polypyramis BW_CC]